MSEKTLISILKAIGPETVDMDGDPFYIFLHLTDGRLIKTAFDGITFTYGSGFIACLNETSEGTEFIPYSSIVSVSI